MGTKRHRRARGAPSPRTNRVQELGVKVEAPPARRADVTEAQLDESGFAGAHVRGEFRCADCGYGAIVRSALPACPMCGGTAWESRGPLGRPSS